jgi:hypothetical protein
MTDSLPRWFWIWAQTAMLIATLPPLVRAADEASKWTRSPQFDETSRTQTIDGKIRLYVNAPRDDKGQPACATRLIIYTLPAGNTIEQTLGCQPKKGLDWHYDIQHVAAQLRLLRSLLPSERIVLVCPEGPGLSWSPYRKAHPDADARMTQLVDDWRKEFGTGDTRVMLVGHSNGGSFMFGVIDGAKSVPSYIDRIAFLDSNYNFDAARHSEKLARWLKGDESRRLIVVAYDDREITLNGKKVLGPTGGTYRATGRMRDALGKTFPLTMMTNPPFQESVGLDGRIHFYVHPNPENKILHTLLVGEMNGLVHAATLGTPDEEKWGHFGGPRAYTKYIQAEPTPGAPKQSAGTTNATTAKSLAPSAETTQVSRTRLNTVHQAQFPPRPKDAIGGAAFMKSIGKLPRDDREAAILREITRGNFPKFLREFKVVPVLGSTKSGDKEVPPTIEVLPDYLAVGSDSDFVRIPMTPQTAQKIADQFGCMLPTRKLVDAIDRVAEVRVAPHPMTVEREAVATFTEHNSIIEKQRGQNQLGLLTIGSKKDIVLTPRIFEKPKRLAIYGWRQLNGQPIQPLTIVHVNWYVDYSHGVRLVRDRIELDGKNVKISDLLADPERSKLVSDEGPMQPPRYPDK